MSRDTPFAFHHLTKHGSCRRQITMINKHCYYHKITKRQADDGLIRVIVRIPFKNFTFHFGCEKHMELKHFSVWNFQFTYEMGRTSQYEIPNSHVNWIGSKFCMRNLGVWNMCFTYEMEHSHTKINFTYEILTSHMELKQFTNEILSSFVKLHVKFL